MPITDPHDPSVLLGRFRAAGFAATSQGIHAALESDDPASQVLGLRVARLGKDPQFEARARELMQAGPIDVELGAAAFLSTLGDAEAQETLHWIADVDAKSLAAYDVSSQHRVVEACRALAQVGNEGYCYQLPILLVDSLWSAKSAAAAALGSFQDLTDPSLEMAWLTAIGVFDTALDHEDVRLREHAPLYAQGFLSSALRQKFTTQKIIDAITRSTQRVDEKGLDDLHKQFRQVLDKLGSLELVTAVDSAPPFDEDPRVRVWQSTNLVVGKIDDGDAHDVLELMDVENGSFEGLEAEAWIEMIELEMPPLEGGLRGYANENPKTSRRRPGVIEVTLNVDVFNRRSKVWEAMVWEFRFDWWGFGWHMTNLERFVNYELVEEEGNEFGETLALTEDLVEPMAPLLALFKAMDENVFDNLDALLAEGGRFRGLTKEQFIESRSNSISGHATDQHTVIPAEYVIVEQGPELVSGQVQIAALTEGRHTPVRVTWEFRVIKRGGRWKVLYWQDVSRG